jgi:Trypsin-co-occurring domain 1
MSSPAPLQAIDVGGLYIQVVGEPELVEQDSEEGYGGMAAASDVVDRLDAIGEKIGEVCSRLQTSALAAVGTARPDKLEIDFSVTLAGKAGIPLVSSGSVEGSFTVKATWDFTAKSAAKGSASDV